MLKRAMATAWSGPGSNYCLIVTAQLTNQNAEKPFPTSKLY